MNDSGRADQPDSGPRLRHPRRWRAWWRRGGARRTVRGHGLVVEADWFDPRMTDFLGDTAWLVGQPVPVASLGDAVINLSSCMLPAWPPAPTARRKDSRPLHPTAPPRADRRRQFQRTSGAGRGRRTQVVPAARVRATLTLCQVRPTPWAATRAMGTARQALTGQTVPALASPSPCDCVAVAAPLWALRLSVPLLSLPYPLIRAECAQHLFRSPTV
jgi:hypothetical protein